MQKQESKDKKSWNHCTKVYKHSNTVIKDKSKFIWHSKVQNKREGMKKKNQAEIQEGKFKKKNFNNYKNNYKNKK